MKKSRIMLLALALLLAPVNPIFVSADVPAAVNYLSAQTQDAWVTQALVAAGQASPATDHLKTVSGTLATDYAKTILALAAAGQNPRTFGSLDYVAKLKTFYADNQFGSTALVNDDIWSLLALASIKDTAGQEFTDAKNFIIANQNTDGGWSYDTTSDSDSNDTAAAIIALIEAGVPTGDQKVTDAVNYLKTVQNADGGFAYQAGADSDSGSDAWVIAALNKLGLDAATWTKGTEDPIKHLQSLQDTDGGFWWVAPGTSEFNNKAMTAYAVIALSDKSFPVGYYQPAAADTFSVRIEGQNETICKTEVAGPTAMDLVKNAASVCGYTYNITQESYGLYLRAINDEQAEGMTGWLYFINHVSPAVGAGDYLMQPGDEAIFYYGQWGWNPTKLDLSATQINAGQTVNVSAKYYNGSSWLPVPSSTVYVNGTARQADAAGNLDLTFEQNGVYELYLQTTDFVRSDKYQITVGSAIAQPVSLQAEIDQSTGTVLGASVALEIAPAGLNFGKLKPGQSASQTLTLKNTGSGNINVGANVTGDSLFVSSIKINTTVPSQFLESLAVGAQKTATVQLAVPAGYTGAGIKQGQLIFWATAGN